MASAADLDGEIRRSKHKAWEEVMQAGEAYLDTQASFLAEDLVELAGLGAISPVVVQRLANSGVRDGLVKLELLWLAKMGAAGPWTPPWVFGVGVPTKVSKNCLKEKRTNPQFRKGGFAPPPFAPPQ